MALCASARQGELDMVTNAMPRVHGAVIADFACGDGYLAKHLARTKPDASVVAIEVSGDLLQNLRAARVVECAQVANLCALPFQSGRFDVVVSLASMHHVAHKKRVFAEVARLLRTGGSFVIADVADGTPTQAFFDDVCASYCFTGHDFDFIDTSWIAQLGAKTGFALDHAEVVQTPWRFDTKDHLIPFVRGLLGLDIEDSLLDEKLREHLAVTTRDGAWYLAWELGCYRLQRTA